MERLQHFFAIYQRIDKDSLHLLADIYSEDIEFIDPIHTIVGRADLHDYFTRLYQTTTSVSFSLVDAQPTEQGGSLQWLMHYCHPRLAGGDTIEVAGASFVEFNKDGKAYRHRDYYDGGALLYEHIPLLGDVVRYFKKRLSQ
jgi:hypothetical protein